MDVLMPQLGETVAEGKISAWFKKPGDRVNAGDNLFEVETDKTAMEVPVTAAGIVAEIRVAAGETVPVGTVVAVIADSVGAVAAGPLPAVRAAPATAPIKAPTAAPTMPIAGPARPLASTPYDPFREVRTPRRNFGPARLGNGIVVTPLARRLAAEAGVDPLTLKGSGPHGRIVARDVESARPVLPGGSLNAKPASTGSAPFDIRPISLEREAFAAAVAHAKRTVPHFHVRRDVSLDALLHALDEINAVADGRFQVTVIDCIVKALAIALGKFPAANASWTQEHMLRYRQCDLAVAVPTADGIARPVIHAVDSKGVGAIAAERADLRERVRTGALASGDVTGGTATVWDLSAYPVRSFTPVVLPPNALALAVGAVAKRPGVDGHRLAVETRATLTLSCDHRIIDGVLGAELLGACVRVLERPLALIL